MQPPGMVCCLTRKAKRTAHGVTRCILDTYLYGGRFGGPVGVYLHVFNVYFIKGLEMHVADNTVPIGLRFCTNGVCIFEIVYRLIVDAYTDFIFPAWLCVGGDIV